MIRQTVEKSCPVPWRQRADDIRGKPLPCGHFIPEEKPEELVAELSRFLAET